MTATVHPQFTVPDPIKHLPGHQFLGPDPFAETNNLLHGHIPNPVSSITNPITAAGKAASALGNPDTWVRVGEVVAGVILLAVGLDYMLKLGMVEKAGKAALLA